MRFVVWKVVFGLMVLPLFLFWLWLAAAPKPPLLDGVDFSPLVLDREVEPLRMGLTSDEKFRLRVRLDEIAPEAVNAALRYEDRHFYRHPGVNPFSMLRAGLSMLGGSRRMGGSTITMQVARLRLGLSTTTVAGKLEQMARALQYEYHYEKSEILEAYFNLAPYGGNVEGIGAAARVYFHVSPSRLSFSESAALAAVPQNPVRRSPLNGPDFESARARMVRLVLPGRDAGEKGGALGLGGSGEGKLPPLRVYAPSSLPFDAPHASSELLPLSREGRPVRSFVDRRLQKILERAVQGFAARGRRYGLNNASALLIHWPSMEIRALVGSADFFSSPISGQVDGTNAKRSPGSTLKPFIYALALDQGLIHPRTLLEDSPRSFGGYDPENFDRVFRGPLPAEEALRSSRNIPAILLASKLRPGLFSFLQRAGVEFAFSEEHYGLSLVLGGAEVTMRELGGLYAMLANRGVWRQSRLFEGEKTRPAVSLLSPEAAVVTLRMLEDGAHFVRTSSGPVPLRFKTGTSNGFRDAWTAGVVGPYVLVVWAGNFDNRANPLLVGGEVAAPLFADIAQALAFAEPDFADLVPRMHEGLNITREKVCTATGDIDTSLCRETTETWYIPGRSPTRSSGVFRTILIDRETGLRACEPVPGRTEEVVWEFWPSDLRAQFLRAGVVKPSPPPFGPGCGQTPVAGTPPRVISPKEGVIYQRRLSSPKTTGIALTASADADARAVFWFVKERFIGRAAPGETLLWQPEEGVHELRVVDDKGRASSQKVTVRTLP